MFRFFGGDCRVFEIPSLIVSNLDPVDLHGLLLIRWIEAQMNHAAFDIGRYGWHKSIWGPPLQKTLPGLLKENGHATASVGKWHLGFGREGELVR